MPKLVRDRHTNIPYSALSCHRQRHGAFSNRGALVGLNALSAGGGLGSEGPFPAPRVSPITKLVRCGT